MKQPIALQHVDSISHNGTVVAFAEEWIENDQEANAAPLADDPDIRRLWYRVLDLEQTADQDQDGAWEDAKRWTRWYEVPWPPQLRPVGLGLLTVDCTAEHNFATIAGRWQVITDGAHIYLFRALNLQHALDRKRGKDDGAARVYANRYTLARAPSPDSGTNKAAKGQEVTVPQLRLAREARYRRSAMRESPLGDSDSQGTRDIDNLAFIEPTMEWSMLRPIDGAFSVTLTPSNVPGRQRWQFFCRWQRPSTFAPATLEPAVAAFSMLRDEDGWADLAEEFDQLNTAVDPFHILPDAVFTLDHPDHGPLQLRGRPDALTFRLQEQGAGSNDGEERAISPQRVMMAARVAVPDVEPTSDPEGNLVTDQDDRLAVLDFGLTKTGAVEVGHVVALSNVDFARTALWLNSDADRVELLPADKQVQRSAAFAVHVWVRHDEGSGTLVCRGWNAGEDPLAAGKAGWAIEWRADRRQVVGVRVLKLEDDQGGEMLQRFEVPAPAPVSFTWHHIALIQEEDAKLALYIDGALAEELAIDVEPISHEVSAAISVGGPVHDGPDGSWLDFRVDQVVVWQRAVVPSLATIYVELDEAARQEEELVGYWTFDRGAGNDVDVDDDAGYAASYTDLGADVVSQTAPLFPAEKAEFEKHLGGMSADMGLLEVPGWQLRSAPRLFIGADGIVRLYAIARHHAENVDVAGGLVYDTTTTRAQFTFDWTAAGDQSTQAGALILQARKAGPVMNRAALTLTLDEASDALTLAVVHPHREDLAEIWRNLPRDLDSFIAVVNGRASAERDDEAVKAGDLPYYDYGAYGPQANRAEPYPSKLIQAVPLSVPDNGAAALLQPGIAVRRQQGNFTGWTRAPLMLSGRFDGAKQGPAVANVDLANDRMERLRIPGDFAVEAWVQPQGGGDVQRIVNWLQGDNDGVSLGLQIERRLRLSASVPTVELVTARNKSWFQESANHNEPGVALKTRFQLPLAGGSNGPSSLVMLESRVRIPLDLYAMLEYIGRHGQEGWEDNLGEFNRDPTRGRATPGAPHATAEVEVQYRLVIDGRRVRFNVVNEVTPIAELPTEDVEWTNPLTDETFTPEETKTYTEEILLPLWQDLVAGKQVTPPGAAWWFTSPNHEEFVLNATRTLIDVPLVGRDEGDEVEVAIIFQPDKVGLPLFGERWTEDGTLLQETTLLRANRGRVSCYIDGQPASVFRSAVTPRFKDGWLAPIHKPETTRIVLGQVGDLPPFTGVINTVEVWAKSREFTAVPGPFDNEKPLLAVDLQSPQEVGGEVVVAATGTLVGTEEKLHLPLDAFLSAFRVRPTLGDRRYSTVQTFASTDWRHLSLVCADNFAVRFARDGDRAVIKDADGLNPDQAFTIACVVVREQSDTRQDVFSKVAELGDDQVVTFRLSIDPDGKPRLTYTLEVEGKPSVRMLIGGASLDVGRPYHLFAAVSLQEVFSPPNPVITDKPKPRWQIWLVEENISLFDIASATWVGEKDNASPLDQQAKAEDRKNELVEEVNEKASFEVTNPPVWEELQRHWRAARGMLTLNKDSEPFYDLRIKASSVPAAIGAATGENADQVGTERMGWFRGVIGAVQFWRARLPGAAIERLALELKPGLPSGVDKPAAWWRFDENRGLQAQDSAGSMTATLAREEMWVNSRATARLTLLVDGRPVFLKALSSKVDDQSVEYGAARRFTLGGMVDENNSASETFAGGIDEVRVWQDVRTNEEILDNMHSRLRGNEDDLVAYWPINAGVGRRIKDTAGGGNHAILGLPGQELDQEALQAFWQRVAAPVGDDLPQVRHMLGGLHTSWTATKPSTAPIAAEYGDLQTDPDGRLRGVQKRALIFGRVIGKDVEAEQENGWANLTGFKTGDLDLIYIGQAQSDPTLIGYIEGAPPAPSENLTRAYWTSAPGYNAYSGNTDITLEEAANTSIMFNAEYDRGFDLSIAGELLFGFASATTVGTGVALGGFVDVELEAAKFEVNVGPKATFEHSQGWTRSFGMTIGTARTLSNTLALGGSWEPANSLLNEGVGRRYLPDNVGYALVKSGVANVYVLRLRKNGAMLGVRMVPDPDIPEDLNILSFRMRGTYTKQGTLDGMVGFTPDPDWPDAMQSRGSYFQPREVANLEAEIEAYEAKLLATYDQFDAGAFGRRSKGIHFQEDDPAVDPKQVVEDNVEVPYDWEKSLSKRNIVNTYVWTSSGGFLAEELRTSIVRTESQGGSYSFKGMGGVKFSGQARLAVGVSWDLEALFGGHIETTVVKTKEEGREFGLAVNVGCDDLLERYVGEPDQLYSGAAAPGKVQGYRFKSFYLVPDKQHFEHFWSSVVDDDWLQSDDADARALRQARAKANHVWRVFHRVTYVNRVPPASDEPLPAPVKTTRSVIHQGANWQNIKLVLDVLRDGVTSTGESIDGLGNPYEKIAVAVDDLLRNQWAPNAPWWQAVVDGFVADSEGEAAKVFRELRRATYEYMKAYYETGLLDQDPRLTRPPLGLPGPPGRRVTEELTTLYTFMGGSGDTVKDVSNVGDPLDLTITVPDAARWSNDPANPGLIVTDVNLIQSEQPATSLIDAIKASQAFTLEVWVTPDQSNPVQRTPARIVTISKDAGNRNTTLGQYSKQGGKDWRGFSARVRMSGDDPNGTGHELEVRDFDSSGRVHLVYVCDMAGKVARLFADNVEVASQDLKGDGALSWSDDYRLALADELSGERAWLGTYHLVAIYARALSAEEVTQNFHAGLPSHTLPDR